MNKSSRKKGSRNPRNRSGGSVLQPPVFVPTLCLSHTFRYLNSALGSFNITRENILNSLLLTPTAVTSVRLLQAARLKSVEIWGNAPALGSSPTILQMEWTGENSPSTFLSDTSMGVRPAHIRSSPPPSSSNRWWSISGSSETDVLFSLVLPANCVIDVTLELRLVETEPPTAGDVPVGATVGKIYGDYLDGIASGILVPTGLAVLP